MLRREPVVEREHRRAGVVAERAAHDVVGLDVAKNATATMHKRNGRTGRSSLIGRNIFAQAESSDLSRNVDVDGLADPRRRDLCLAQRAAILVARRARGERPKRRGGRRRRPIQKRFSFAVEFQIVTWSREPMLGIGGQAERAHSSRTWATPSYQGFSTASALESCEG